MINNNHFFDRRIVIIAEVAKGNFFLSVLLHTFASWPQISPLLKTGGNP
jgi:hypothetical protein